MGTETGAIFKTLWAGNFQYYFALFLAFQIFLFNGKKRKGYWIMMPILAAAGYGFRYLKRLDVGGFGFDGLLCVLAVLLTAFILFKESMPTLLCVTAMSMGMQSILWNVSIMIYDWIPNSGEMERVYICLINYGVYILLYGGVFAFIFFKKHVYRWKRRDALSFVFGTLLILFSYVIYQFNKSWNALTRLLYSMLMGLGIIIELLIPYLIEVTDKARAYKDEKANLEALLSLQAHQNELSKQEQDILNMKVHDFKNQLNTLLALDEKAPKKDLEELQKTVDFYGAYAKTGNEAIDVILTKKALLCSDKKIRFNYIVDGDVFSSMNILDITSLFCNVIDNAIEATEKEEGDCRLIKLNAFRKGNFVSLIEENYCHSDIDFSDNGLPISKKEDKAYHGFGTKSMKYIAKKYGGTYSFSHKDGIFRVSILLPIAQ